ncbi:MAG TPA: ankyrin repeat domain-containing protein [Mycobacteriales bacterium]|nr:ankyrin repeat domain-containing protein [Mycobacteriales bacterium]
MPALPAHANLDQLRHQAKDLWHAAGRGESEARAALLALSTRPTLATAQLAVARGYGFAGWARLKVEVERREILSRGDADRLTAFLAAHPGSATELMDHWRDQPKGATPLGYVAMLRYDTTGRAWRDVPGTAAMARALLAAGAPVDGRPEDRETPLITAASYGDAEVAAVLIAAGADLDATAAPDAGGVPGGTALRHAAVFGMTAVVDLLAGAGARIDNLTDAAAVGAVTGWLQPDTPVQDRVRALVMAADHQRLAVIDQLLDAGTPIDATDTRWGRQALRLAAMNGRVASVRHLIARGADPDHRDPVAHRTALDWCRRNPGAGPESAQVEAILGPVTTGAGPERPAG